MLGLIPKKTHFSVLCSALLVAALIALIVVRAGWLAERRVILTAPAGGIVTLDGESLADATIVFLPLDPSGAGACSLSDEHGVFQLQTWLDPQAPLLGAAPGDYAVAVSKYATNGTVERPVDHLLVRETLLTPPQYRDPKTSLLRATVVEGGENRFRLRLLSAAKEATD